MYKLYFSWSFLVSKTVYWLHFAKTSRIQLQKQLLAHEILNSETNHIEALWIPQKSLFKPC